RNLPAAIRRPGEDGLKTVTRLTVCARLVPPFGSMLETQVLCGKRLIENLPATERRMSSVNDRRTVTTAVPVTVALVAPVDPGGAGPSLPLATVGMVCVCLPVGHVSGNHTKLFS
uniref:Uncharacterized protein n=1 Tax=Anopheles atroparvus TaxID=41427 RepID=A0AAG5D975_ANOAO